VAKGDISAQEFKSCLRVVYAEAAGFRSRFEVWKIEYGEVEAQPLAEKDRSSSAQFTGTSAGGDDEKQL
jgi:hypothetical protein